ncbi:imelysin family protein [Dyadobacter tibetensis]|uniref:imelysin family protein n=1 Tax=Dyadobacter tibetensis TaxID=1211851 RepID=UPI00046EAFCE|nr:imelysin family protein [Dyadobacter tibetensis]
MKKVNFCLPILLIGLIFILGACSEKGGESSEPDVSAKNRTALMINLSDQIILPSYASYKTKLEVMVEKSEAFSAQPDIANLQAFRLAWEEAYISWQKVELFDFGPASRHAIRNYHNIYPTNTAGIEANIQDANANLEAPYAYDKQGYPALDYLLNGLGSTDAAIVAAYKGQDGAKRLAYIRRLTGRMQTLLSTVVSEWNGSYRTEFVSKTGLDIGSPLGELVNGYIAHYERYIRSGKIGIPSGALVNGITSADKVEAYYKKDLSKKLAQSAHEAAVNFFNGVYANSSEEGPSLKSYLNALGTKDLSSGLLLSEVINSQFSKSNEALKGLNDNFYLEVTTNNQAMLTAYAELQKVVRLLKVDMTSAMSITITYTDNDGD